MAELEACRCESRNYSSEVFRLKAACDESMEQLDVVKRENKVEFFTFSPDPYSDPIHFLPTHIAKLTLKLFFQNLADEIKDLLDQLGDGGRSIHELDKQRRRLEVEKEELQGALEEAEGALEQEENKVIGEMFFAH